MEFTFSPIGMIQSGYQKKYQAPRQAHIESADTAVIELAPHQNFETALADLEGFSHIWLIYVFHLNSHWKPKVLPPRYTRKKKGVFATRSPYRPNPIGLTVVKLNRIEGRTLYIEDHDLLDGTPILDIKPYLSYSDSHPEADQGWIGKLDEPAFELHIDDNAADAFDWLTRKGVNFQTQIERVLRTDPYPHPYRRISDLGDHHQIRYQEWCADYHIDSDQVRVYRVYSGFEANPLSASDPEIHQQFIERF